MKSTNRSVLLALLATFAVPAVAAEAPKKAGVKFQDHFCKPGEELSDATESCLDNQVFVDAADDCLERLRAEADRVSKGMAGSFSKDATEAQTNKFSSSNEDYVYAAATFADLIKLTNQVMDEVDSYLDYMNLPEDIGNDEATGGDPAAFAEKMPCYSETQESLDGVQDDLDVMLKEFTDGKKVSDSAAGTTAAHKAGLDEKTDTSTPGASLIRAGRGAGSGIPVQAPGAGKAKNSGSDITGLKQEKQKQQQK